MRFANWIQRELYYDSQIGCCYWAIQEIAKCKGDAKTPIEAMIDEATGFDEGDALEQIETCIGLTKTIIRCKKKIDWDVDNDKTLLKKLRELKKKKKKEIKS